MIAEDAPAPKNNGHEPLAARDAADRIDAFDAVDMADPLNGFEYRTGSSDLDRRDDV